MTDSSPGAAEQIVAAEREPPGFSSTTGLFTWLCSRPLNSNVMLLRPIHQRVIGAAVLIIGALSTCACGLFYIDRELSGPVTLNETWLELTPREPLTIARDTHELTLFPDPPIQMVDGPPDKGLIASDGRDADIEAELLGSNGTTYRSSPGRSETMTGDLKITSRRLGFKDLPSDVTYSRVRIRSSAPYPVKRILWRNYNWGSVNK
jgi:hypothetical protein